MRSAWMPIYDHLLVTWRFCLDEGKAVVIHLAVCYVYDMGMLHAPVYSMIMEHASAYALEVLM